MYKKCTQTCTKITLKSNQKKLPKGYKKRPKNVQPVYNIFKRSEEEVYNMYSIEL